ncbi:hypothetical protein VNO78_25676 [Psophocarpus tetragonolobus]|uniref:DUF3741 domain-containing protein n=1 Tax=Psophocarpus tetragonolobus TaxID=3891 RepID=A0AAN9S877_PSOTE
MAKPERPQQGCFPSLLRVLLCATNGTSPPVHPSDHFTESEEKENEHSTKEAMVVNDGSSTTPGVVARLMGLDSLPKTKFVVKCGTPDSAPRSRSVNFVDYLLEFDTSNVNHRRVKTSSSFREVPSLLHNQKGNNNNNLFVFCMDGNIDNNNMSEDQELRRLQSELGELRQRKRQGSKSKGSERVSVKRERDQGKNKKISKLKNEPRRVPSSKHGSKSRNHEAKDFSSVSSSSSKCSSCSNRHNGATSRSRLNTSLPNKHKKELFVKPKKRNNMRSQQSLLNVGSECSLENHSPVSVVDSNDYPFLYGTDFLDGQSSIASKSKWESPSLLSLDHDIEDSASTNKDHTFIDVNKEAEYYSELMLKLRTITEQDIRESDCTSKNIHESESFRDICFMFEHKIFDHLLYEVVNEVLEFYC